jgi:hypothetical protein
MKNLWHPIVYEETVILFYGYGTSNRLGAVMVSALSLDPRVAGSNPAEAMDFSRT